MSPDFSAEKQTCEQPHLMVVLSRKMQGGVKKGEAIYGDTQATTAAGTSEPDR